MNARSSILAFALMSVAAAAPATGTDADFATKAGQANLAEVAAGRLAVSQGGRDDVKTFGQRMIDDHSKANDELAAAAATSGASVPTGPSVRQQAGAAELARLRGAAFDARYADMMVKDHQEAVALFRKESGSGADPALREFARKTLPVLETHLKMAKDLRHAR